MLRPVWRRLEWQQIEQGLSGRAWLAPFLLVVLAALAYANSFPATFILDDLPIVRDNPLVQQLDLGLILRSDYWGPHANDGLYRPLTILSLGVNRLLLGEGTWGFHLVNVGLHIGVTLLFCRVLTGWGMPLLTAFAAAALFAVHPIHTEVVNVVVGRSELLVACLLLAAFWQAQKERWTASLATVVFFVLALLSKEHAVTFVVLLPLVDLFHKRNLRALGARIPLYVALVVMVLIWLVWRRWGVGHPGPVEVPQMVTAPLAYVATPVRVMTALKLQGLYLAKLVWPANLHALYQGSTFPGMVSPWSLTGMTLAGTVLVVAATVLFGMAKGWWWACFVAFYGIAFLPAGNLFFPTGVTFAERLAYFPSLWFCAGVAVLVAELAKARPHLRRLWFILPVLIVVWGGRTWARNMDFADPVRLFAVDVQADPTNVLAGYSLAESYARAGRNEDSRRVYDLLYNLPEGLLIVAESALNKGDDAEAEAAFRAMLGLPGGATVYALNAWSAFLLDRGRPQEALAPARAALGQSLESCGPLVATNATFVVEALLALKQFDDALGILDQATAQCALEKDILEDLRGRILADSGRDREAVAAFEQVREWPPYSLGPLRFGLALLRLGRLDEACKTLELAQTVNESAEGWSALGLARTQQGRPQEALAAFERAVQLAPENPDYQAQLLRARSAVR